MDTNAPDDPRPSVYDENGEPGEPAAPVGQAEPDSAEPDAPVDLPTTSTDPPAAS
jgi:hypothetical protein